MTLSEPTIHTLETKNRPKWFNSPVTIHKGSLEKIRARIPTFERRNFGLAQAGGEKTGLNGRLDTIVRLPIGEDKAVIPIGVVSKDYILVPHSVVLDEASRAFELAEVSVSVVDAELKLTEYGERMALRLYLPPKYDFDPGDGHFMKPHLECLNSVDGSTRFQSLMGWFRLVCSNGLIIGVTRSTMRRRHVGNFHIEDIGAVFASGLVEYEIEKNNFEKWRKKRITMNQLIPWADDTLRKEWGFKAAARAYHIARTGTDVKISGNYTDRKPTTIAVKTTKTVPGSPNQSHSLFDVSQILAWLAKERRDIQEQLEWRAQIPDLLKSLK